VRIDPDVLYSTSDLMELFNVGRQTVYRYIENEGLPVVRLSRQRIFVMGDELRKWLRTRRT
jgi:excisionase family DNA binding protein